MGIGGAADRMTVRGVDLEVVRNGTGHPLLLLHGMGPVDANAPFIEALGRHARVLAPSHPGFGSSKRPDGFETVYDLTRLYLDVIDTLSAESVTLVGLSFGGWVAAEIAAVAGKRIDRLILVDPLGIKISDRETPDILDVFNTHPDDVRRARWRNPESFAPDLDALSDEQLATHARNWDTLCLYGWSPYMFNPQLARWLPRISARTLVLWGADDGIVQPAYGRAYSALIPGAEFSVIDAAGHHPEIEQADAFSTRVRTFLDAT